MSEAYISGQIASQQQRLRELRADLRQLEERLEELYRLQARFHDVQVDFDARKNRRLSVLQGFSRMRSRSLIAGRFQDGMSGMLTGADYRAASYDLNQGAQRIEDEIRATRQRLGNTQQEIRTAERTVDRLNYELRQAQIARRTQQASK